MALMESVAASFITIFAIMDPFASIPPFLALTSKCSKEETRGVADKAVLIAGILAIIFAVAGAPILSALSITLSDFRIAGGSSLCFWGLKRLWASHFRRRAGNQGAWTRPLSLLRRPS